MVEEIRYLVHELRGRIDRPPDWYAGPCRSVTVVADVVCDLSGMISLDLGVEKICHATLWTRLDSRYVVCRECQVRHPVAERRTWLVTQVADALVPLNMLVDALPTLIGVTVSRDTARKWVARGRLQPRGLSVGGVDLFRGADVMELARSSQARRKVPA